MIKQMRASYFHNFKNAQYCALSDDPIPNDLENGDEVYIIDQGKIYYWDASSSSLYEYKGGGSGSGGSSSFIPCFGSLGTVALGTTWSGNDPYTSTVTVTGYTVTDQTMVSVLPSEDVIEQMLTDGITNIFITNNDGVLTATAIGAVPTVPMTLQVLCTESDISGDIAELPSIVGSGIIETVEADNLTDAVNILGEDVDELKNAISQLGTETDSLLYEGLVVNVSTYTNYQYLISSTSGKWVANTNYKSRFVGVPTNSESVTIKAPANTATIVALLKNSNHTENTFPDYATGGSRLTVNAGTELTLDIPSDGKILWVWIGNNNTASTPDKVEFKIKDHFFQDGLHDPVIAPKNDFLWTQGAFDRNLGVPLYTEKAIRCTGFVPENVMRLTCPNEYKMIIWAWNAATGEFVGHLGEDNIYGTSTTYYFQREIIIDHNAGYQYKVSLYNADASAIAPSAGANVVVDYVRGTKTGLETLTVARNPVFIGSPVTIFENDDEYAIADVDDGVINAGCVVKINDEMYYLYYESCGANETWGSYSILKTCFAYSTDGEHFTKGFPSGIEAPISGTNMLFPAGTVGGPCVVKVPDPDYPYRLIGMVGTDPDRIAKIWKSTDGINWTFIRVISGGYNDCNTACVVRGNTLKIFLRTRNPVNRAGRAVGIMCTDLDGNRYMSSWTSQVSLNDTTKQIYQSSASPFDDHREILFPTIYNPLDSSEYVGCFILDGNKSEYIAIDNTAVMPTDVKSIYMYPGIVNIGLKTYLYYETRDTDHEHTTSGVTKSAIMRIEIGDSTLKAVVYPSEVPGSGS